MTHLTAIILGFVEGATEFIPVSSSGHLIIAHYFLGTDSGGLTFDAIIQLATACVIPIYFWKDILNILKTVWNMLTGKPVEQKEKTLVWAIIIGTIPAVIFGLLLENTMDTLFRSVSLVALTLALGSLLFWYAQGQSKKIKEKGEVKTLSLKRGIIIGFYQCLALIPGVSRSGATISGGLIEGLSQEEAVRFSFLLSIPVLFGGGLKKLFEVRDMLFTPSFLTPILLGSVVAFVTGLLSIHFLIKYLKNHDLDLFIWYRVILALLLVLFI